LNNELSNVQGNADRIGKEHEQLRKNSPDSPQRSIREEPPRKKRPNG
jgi:hypothetical protein